ncbi:hypothetical protein SynBIOSU31_00258 [Synechococcus sp. BIOS-U3-1]|uniref:hypothetical protein n=1 Tax=Synechococcus sp. BIOS-U3-1 TaxID=1400865 RepID=UPI001645FEE2|nr:hypothetical protein [Synechococcus sp. BIOS-U3-1]QNI57170.1 hypothetical protein SynBIOSU31_00258 [Synechococcus sp. BIOS-U3-1]
MKFKLADKPIVSREIVKNKFDTDIQHFMLPVVESIQNSVIAVLFADRDAKNRSFIRRIHIDMEPFPHISGKSVETVFQPGELGCFDDNGVSPSSVVSSENITKLLYYIGWKPRSTVRFGLFGGLAIQIAGNKYTRVSRAPIFTLSDSEPFHVLTAPWVLFDKKSSIFRMWYVSGTGWKSPDTPCYNIKYAESSDGKHWDQNICVCLDNTEEITSLARPSVIKTKNGFHMWYSKKSPKTEYSIHHVYSVDGKNWGPMENSSELSLHSNFNCEWASEMVCYSYPFVYNNNLYIFHNGNGYGSTGFGITSIPLKKLI